MHFRLFIFSFTAILLIITALISLWVGQYPINLNEYKQSVLAIFGLASREGVEQILYIIEEIRVPRILAAILVGASLSVSGAVFQGIFVNPLVSPGILGVLSGASFGAALGMVLRGGMLSIQLLAFVFGFIAVFASLSIARMKGNSVLMLVLGGIISSAFFGSMLSLLKYTADPYRVLPEIVYWLMGSLASSNLTQIYAVLPWILCSLIFLSLLSKQLNILSLGDDDAKALGVDVAKIRIVIIVLSTILSSLSVMISGVIGWIGLVVPHIARMIIGANHKWLIPMSALVGGIFLLLADSISRSVFPAEIPLGIVTSLVGIPIFIVVLFKTKRGDGGA